MTQYALTTFDNPYDPFDDFDRWMLFDEEKGYGTMSYLGRIARTSDELTDEENNKEVERAIDEIISMHKIIENDQGIVNVYKKVSKKLATNNVVARKKRKYFVSTYRGRVSKSAPPPQIAIRN